MSRWTAAEDARVRAEFPDARTADLAEAMGRTAHQIGDRARLLKVTKSPAYRAQMAQTRIRARVRPEGTERRTKSGTVLRKVNGRWLCPARAAFTGEVPAGFVVRASGHLAPRADLMRENSWQRYAPELTQLFRAKAQLTRRIQAHAKQERY